MNMKASDMNELCDNTVKTHHVNWSDFLKKLGFLDKNNSFYFWWFFLMDTDLRGRHWNMFHQDDFKVISFMHKILLLHYSSLIKPQWKDLGQICTLFFSVLSKELCSSWSFYEALFHIHKTWFSIFLCWIAVWHTRPTLHTPFNITSICWLFSHTKRLRSCAWCFLSFLKSSTRVIIRSIVERHSTLWRVTMWKLIVTTEIDFQNFLTFLIKVYHLADWLFSDKWC